MRKFKQLTLKERYQIAAYKEAGYSQKYIANYIGVSESTISRERGLNEHTNGLIRQYLPKQTDFTQVKRKQISFIQDRLNNRPRKSLGFKTPSEVFYARVSRVMAA